MKPSVLKVIKYDYFSTFFSIISFALTILLIAIIFTDPTVLGIVIPIITASYIVLILKIYYVRKEVFRLKESRITGKVHRVDSSNGTFYIVVNYEVKTRSLGRRFPLLAGRVLRSKLSKIEDIELLVDMDHPKKVYIAQFYYNN